MRSGLFLAIGYVRSKLRGRDSNTRSPAYEAGEDDQLLHPAQAPSYFDLRFTSRFLAAGLAVFGAFADALTFSATNS